MRVGHHILCEVLAMPINQPNTATIAAEDTPNALWSQRMHPPLLQPLLCRTAIEFPRLVSLYHSNAGASHCCADQPIALLVTTHAISDQASPLATLPAQQTRSADYKGQLALRLNGGSPISKTERDRIDCILDKAPQITSLK